MPRLAPAFVAGAAGGVGCINSTSVVASGELFELCPAEAKSEARVRFGTGQRRLAS